MQYRAILGLKYGNHENDFSTHKPKRCNEFQSSYAATRQCVISFPKFVHHSQFIFITLDDLTKNLAKYIFKPIFNVIVCRMSFKIPERVVGC